jgi:hypothetical protein
MGQATAKQLLAIGYQVSGWSRTSSSHQQCAAAGISCYAGQQQLEAFVRAQDVVVCLLPLTEETTGAGFKPGWLRWFFRVQDVVVCLLPLTEETTGAGFKFGWLLFCFFACRSAASSCFCFCCSYTCQLVCLEAALPLLLLLQASSMRSCCRGCVPALQLSMGAGAGSWWKLTCWQHWIVDRCAAKTRHIAQRSLAVAVAVAAAAGGEV